MTSLIPLWFGCQRRAELLGWRGGGCRSARGVYRACFLLTQFRPLSGQMIDGSRDALLKSTKETVTKPLSKDLSDDLVRSEPIVIGIGASQHLLGSRQQTSDL